MDEITKKRIEKDLVKVDAVASEFSRAADATISKFEDMTALQAELSRLMPDWGQRLTTVPGTMFGSVIGILSSIGAPDGYALALLEAAITGSETPLWPAPGATLPAWVKGPCGNPECTAQHVLPDEPGGAHQRASQAVRVLMFAYGEIRDLIADDLLLSGTVAPLRTDAPIAEIEADEAKFDDLTRERTLAACRFMLELFSKMNVAMMA